MPLNYAALSLAEIRDDLAGTLSEQVNKFGQASLESLLGAIEEDALVNALDGASAAPSGRLVGAMNQLVEMKPYGHLPEPGIRLATIAIQELRLAAGRAADFPALKCLLCGSEFRSTIVEPANGERHETLVCGKHSDQDLRDQGLDDLWGGVEPEGSPSLFEGAAGRVTGVWEQGEGAHTVHILLDDGDLITVLSCGLDSVRATRLPRSQRLLECPLGVPKCNRAPWEQAAREGWQLSSLRPFSDGSVAAQFAGQGTVLFTTYLASWRTLGDGRYFLHEEWTPLRFGPPPVRR